MCTIMIQRETLPAERRSRKASQDAVDKLMAYDKLLSEPFTRNELNKLFFHCDWQGKEDRYSVLSDAEKQIVDAWKLKAQVSTDEPEKVVGNESVFKRATSLIPTIYKPLNYGDSNDISDYRRYLKASLNETPSFDGNMWGRRSNNTGKIYVWLDNMCFGNSNKKGFYYVRWYNSVLDCSGWGGGCSTAYGHPALIVQKNKLRPDQIEYMERKCKETRETKDPQIELGR